MEKKRSTKLDSSVEILAVKDRKNFARYVVVLKITFDTSLISKTFFEFIIADDAQKCLEDFLDNDLEEIIRDDYDIHIEDVSDAFESAHNNSEVYDLIKIDWIDSDQLNLFEQQSVDWFDVRERLKKIYETI
jgi:hypothetical protein